jgi:hypothetical protein
MFGSVSFHALPSRIPLLLGHGGCFVLLKNKILAGLAALALAGGTAMLAMPAANAATMRCGKSCVTLASQKYGSTDVMAVGASSTVGLAAFWYNQGEDFFAQAEGSVNDLYRVGVIAKSVNDTYSTDQVYQYMYAPGGKGTDECLGATPGSAAVTLLPCGASGNTLWVGLSGWQDGNFMPLMSAVSSAKSAMLLTASSATGALAVSQMNLGNDASTVAVSSDQMWETVAGAYGSSSVNADKG